MKTLAGPIAVQGRGRLAPGPVDSVAVRAPGAALPGGRDGLSDHPGRADVLPALHARTSWSLATRRSSASTTTPVHSPIRRSGSRCVNSLVFTVVSITFQFSIGLGLALLFSRGVSTEQHVPRTDAHRMADPGGGHGDAVPVDVQPRLRLVNFILQSLHLIAEPIGWTVDAGAALPAVIIANVWLGIPFNLILLSAAIAGLPSDIYEAATVDGASGWQKISPSDAAAAATRDPGRADARVHLHAAGLRPDLDHDQGRARDRHRGPAHLRLPPRLRALRLREERSGGRHRAVILFVAAIVYLRSAHSDEP